MLIDPVISGAKHKYGFYIKLVVVWAAEIECMKT